MNDGESWLPRTLRGMEIDRRVEVSIRQWPRGDAPWQRMATHQLSQHVVSLFRLRSFEAQHGNFGRPKVH